MEFLLVEAFKYYWKEIVGFSLTGIILLWTVVTTSKYLSFPEVYLKKEGERIPNYLGRKIRFKKSKKDDGLKGKMIIMRDGWFSLGTFTLTIPESIKVEKESTTKMVIRARNIRFEYNVYKSLVPTNKEFQSIHPDEAVFNSEISDKIKVTDSEVRKATNVNPEVSRWQKTSGSIPLSAQREEISGFMDKQLTEIGSFDEEDGDEFSKSQEDKKKGKSYNREEAMKEFNDIVGG